MNAVPRYLSALLLSQSLHRSDEGQTLVLSLSVDLTDACMRPVTCKIGNNSGPVHMSSMTSAAAAEHRLVLGWAGGILGIGEHMASPVAPFPMWRSQAIFNAVTGPPEQRHFSHCSCAAKLGDISWLPKTRCADPLDLLLAAVLTMWYIPSATSVHHFLHYQLRVSVRVALLLRVLFLSFARLRCRRLE